MWFRNLQVYRLPVPWAVSAEQLQEQLAPHAFQPCAGMEMKSAGWVPPFHDGQLVHAVNNQFLISLCIESKLLPASVINQAAKQVADEIEDQQGFKPGRKQMKEIREQVTDDLLPKAFSTFNVVRAWIDPVNGWCVVDAATPSKADAVLKLLFKSIDKLPLETLHCEISPVTAMTDWLASDEAPGGFTVDQDTQLQSNTEGKAAVKFVRHTIDPEDARRHITAGKRCISLAMTWADRISFVLTENLTIKRVKPLDVIKENTPADVADAQERADGDFLLMAGELAKFLADLIAALGGEKKADNK